MKKPKFKIQVNTKSFEFQGIEIDLTYPIGHEKQGKIMDKFCIILSKNPHIENKKIYFYCVEICEITQKSFFVEKPYFSVIDFEVWEIIRIVSYDRKTPYQELFYEGNKHIGNYFNHPKYMSWKDILFAFFDISNPPLHHQGMEELGQLEEDIKYYRAYNVEKELQKAISEHKILSEKLRRSSKPTIKNFSKNP